MVRLTDHPDMTLDVYRGRKTTIQQQPILKQVQYINSLTTKNQTTKFLSANVKSKLYHIETWKTRGQSVDLDRVVHHEPPHQDLRCLQIQLFLSLVLRVNT